MLEVNGKIEVRNCFTRTVKMTTDIAPMENLSNLKLFLPFYIQNLHKLNSWYCFPHFIVLVQKPKHHLAKVNDKILIIKGDKISFGLIKIKPANTDLIKTLS